MSRRKNSVVTREMRINPWLIAVLVSVATFMEVLDTTIANVALRYISGGLAVGPAEAAWTITSYLVANSVVLCAAAGWRRHSGGAISSSPASPVYRGFNPLRPGLEPPVAVALPRSSRLAGGGMTPVAQSILADTFPPEKRGQAFALYRHRGRRRARRRAGARRLSERQLLLALVLPDQRSGRRDLFVLIYMFILENPEARADRIERRRRAPRFDFVGFLLVATFLGALEVVLDKGQEDDWFGSAFIVVFAASRRAPCCCSRHGRFSRKIRSSMSACWRAGNSAPVSWPCSASGRS